MKISVFYHHVCCAAEETGCSLDEMLATIRSWGIGYVELDRDAIGSDDAQLQDLSDRLKQHDLMPSSIYGFYDWGAGKLPDESDLLLHQAELLGCPRVMVIPGFYTDLADAAQCAREKQNMIAGTQAFVQLAAQRNLTVTIECFDDARSPIATIEGMQAFLDAVPQLYVTLETGNFIFSGDDILEAQRRFADRVRHVHLKDRWRPAQCGGQIVPGADMVTAATGETLCACAVGQGHMPIAQVIAGLNASNYDGVMTIEHFGAASYAEAIRASAAWLREGEAKS